VSARRGDGEDAETDLEREDGELLVVADELVRTVSVRVDERGDGPVSSLAASAAELQLMGESRWGM